MQALTLDDNRTRYSVKPPEKEGKLIVIPSSSNMHLLPLFYLIPQELFIRHEDYINMPRNLKAVIDSPEELERIDSDAFKELVVDAAAYAVWDSLRVPKVDGSYMEIPGGMRAYSADFPLWRLSYLIAAEIPSVMKPDFINLQIIYDLPDDKEMGWYSLGEFFILMSYFAQIVIDKNQYQPIINAVWQNRCMEDYAAASTRARNDFERKWHHTRSSKSQILLDEYLEEENDQSVEVLFNPTEEQAISQFHVAAFLATLSSKDKQILSLRNNGYTYGEIADKLGYKTHSGPLKRINAIGRAYEEFSGDFMGFSK